MISRGVEISKAEGVIAMVSQIVTKQGRFHMTHTYES